MALPFTAGQILTAALLNELAGLYAQKSADETVNNSAALQPDDHLFVPVTPGTYELTLRVTQNSAAAAGFKLDFTLPASSTWLNSGYFSCGTSAANEQMGLAATSAISGITGAAADAIVFVQATIVITIAGAVQFRWAQTTANASNTIVRAGSTLSLRKVSWP